MKTKREMLEHQANTIEWFLNSHDLNIRVTGGLVFPRVIRFNLAYGQKTRLNKLRSLMEELALHMKVSFCRVGRMDGFLSIEIPRPDPQPIGLVGLQKKIQKAGELPHCTAVLGLAENGAPLLVRLPSPQVAHILLAGTTGSGKSSLARTIIMSLAMSHRRSQLGLVLIDPKRRNFITLGGLPHLIHPVISDPDEAAEILARLAQLMEMRDKQALSNPRIVVAIDEVADLFLNHPDAQASFTRLAQRGRESGIHLMACTQKPTAQVMNTLAKANFPVRLVGQVTSPEEAKIATGYAGTQAELLKGPGDFLAVAGGRLTRFEAAYLNSRQLALAIHVAAQQVKGQGGGVMLPQLDPTKDTTDKYDKWVGQVLEMWPSLIGPDGELKYGAKATIAELMFNVRSTAGGYGVGVNEVLKRVRARQKKASVASFEFRAPAFSVALEQKPAPKTTTTWPKPLIQVWNWLKRSLTVVVVVFYETKLWSFQFETPRLWSKTKLVYLIRHKDTWELEKE